MIDALRYEVVRLRTLRSTWWLLGSSLVVTTGVALLFSGLSVTHDYHGNLVLALTTLAAQAIPVQALFVGLIGAFAIGHEHRYGTIRLTLVVLPSRGRVLLAKLVVVGAWAVLVAVVTLALAWLAIVVWPGERLRSDPVPSGTLWRVMIGYVLLGLMWAWIGMALAGLLRNLPGAIVILVVWPLVVEAILTGLTFISGLKAFRPATKYLPFGAGQQLLATSPTSAGPPGVHQLSPWEGGADLAVLTVVLVVAWAIAFTRSDA